MKIIKTLTLLTSIVAFSGCQSLVEPEFSNENTLTSVSCVVVLNEKMHSSGSKPEDDKQEFKGVISDNGFVTFPNINSLSDVQKKQASFSAIIPFTCKIIEKDGNGKIIGNGIGGLRSISKKTYYFYVVAANGSEHKYIFSFN